MAGCMKGVSTSSSDKTGFLEFPVRETSTASSTPGDSLYRACMEIPWWRECRRSELATRVNQATFYRWWTHPAPNANARQGKTSQQTREPPSECLLDYFDWYNSSSGSDSMLSRQHIKRNVVNSPKSAEPGGWLGVWVVGVWFSKILHFLNTSSFCSFS